MDGPPPTLPLTPIAGSELWTTQEIADYLLGGRASGKAQPAGPMAEAVDISLRHLTEPDRARNRPLSKVRVPALRDPSDPAPRFFRLGRAGGSSVRYSWHAAVTWRIAAIRRATL